VVIVTEAVAVIEDVNDPVPDAEGVALKLALKDKEELPDALPSSVKEPLSVEDGVGEPKVTDLESLGEVVSVAEAVAVIEEVKDPVPEEDGVALGLGLKE
jgi:hypothetical protein